METQDRTKTISRLQALALEERIAHSEEDEAAISVALDLIEERVSARIARERRSRLLIIAAALVGLLTVVVVLWPRQR